MKLKATRILSGVMAVFLLSMLCVPSFASFGSSYNQKIGFWDWLTDKNSILPDFIGYMTGTICPVSADGYHHANSYEIDQQNGYYTCICSHCGKRFEAYESDLQQSYNDYVGTLPFTGYDSAGSFLWYPSSSNVKDPKIHFATYPSSQHPKLGQHFELVRQAVLKMGFFELLNELVAIDVVSGKSMLCRHKA